MSIINRAKNILLTPKTEWEAIGHESETPQSLLTKYVIPMALVPAVALFIGFGLLEFGVIKWGAIMAIESFIGSLISYFICTYVVDALAPNFGSGKNMGRSAQLVAYSSTAVWVAGIFNIIPSLHILRILGLYSIYLFYLGIPVMKSTPEDKRIPYMVVSALVVIVVGVVVGMIVRKIVFAISGDPFMGLGGGWDFDFR